MAESRQNTSNFIPQSRRQRYDLLMDQMRNERDSFRSHWRDLADFITPRRGRFFVTDVNKGDRRTNKITDSTATTAARTMSAGMMGGVTSPSRPWFRLTTPDPDLSDSFAVKSWLHDVQQRMITAFLKSNLYNALPISYGDLGTFGTAAIYMEEDFEDVFRFYTLPIGSYTIANDRKGRVRVFAREFRMTVRQIVEKFGLMRDGRTIDWTNISDKVRNLWDLGQTEEWIDVCHIILPNDRFEPRRLEAKFKRFASAYWEKGENSGSGGFGSDQVRDKFLRESGHDFFPVLSPRWEVTGEDVYGTNCPGMTALGDIRQLQLGEKRAMQAIEKMVNPPMTGPSALRNTKVSILPGDITYSDEREGQRGFRPAHEVDPRIGELEAKQEQVRDRIKKVFFEDLFLLTSFSDRREVTAREIEERHEEKLIALGAVLERINEDLLDPLIDNAFTLMARQGMIPEPPEELQGTDLKVEYISIMHQAQKLTGLAGIDRLFTFALNVGQLRPDVFDKLSIDDAVDGYADIVGVDPAIVLSEDEVALVRQQRAQAEAAAQQAEKLQQMGAAAKDMSAAKLDEDSVLSRLAQAAGQ